MTTVTVMPKEWSGKVAIEAKRIENVRGNGVEQQVAHLDIHDAPPGAPELFAQVIALGKDPSYLCELIWSMTRHR